MQNFHPVFHAWPDLLWLRHYLSDLNGTTKQDTVIRFAWISQVLKVRFAICSATFLTTSRWSCSLNFVILRFFPHFQMVSVNCICKYFPRANFGLDFVRTARSRIIYWSAFGFQMDSQVVASQRNFAKCGLAKCGQTDSQVGSQVHASRKRPSISPIYSWLAINLCRLALGGRTVKNLRRCMRIWASRHCIRSEPRFVCNAG